MKPHVMVWELMGSVIALAAYPVRAQRLGPGMLRYDPITEMTLSGTVAGQEKWIEASARLE